MLGFTCQFAAHGQTFNTGNSTVDLKPLVSYFSQYVRTIEKPVYLWHYTDADALKDFNFTKPLKVNDPERFEYIRKWSNAYWQDLCSKNPALDPADCDPNYKIDNKDLYGSGLYLARDPVASVRFGKGKGWMLLQLQLPKGLRYFDLRLDGMRTDVPQDVRDVLTNLGCPESFGGKPLRFGWFFSWANPNYGSSRICNLMLRTVLKEHLKIDGFFYPYLTVSFKECTTEVEGTNKIPGEAFVLVDNSKVKNVDVFDAQTTEKKADRLRIQSFFYKASNEDLMYNMGTYFESQTYPEHPGYKVEAHHYSCPPETCEWLALSLCEMDKDNYTGMADISIPYPLLQPGPYPTTMSRRSVPMSQDSRMGAHLLWHDLEGERTDPNLESWMKQNFFKCE